MRLAMPRLRRADCVMARIRLLSCPGFFPRWPVRGTEEEQRLIEFSRFRLLVVLWHGSPSRCWAGAIGRSSVVANRSVDSKASAIATATVSPQRGTHFLTGGSSCGTATDLKLICGMRVQVSHPELLPELLSFLKLRDDTIAERVSEDELEVSLLGSRREDAIELELRLRVWQVAHTGVRVEVLPSR